MTRAAQSASRRLRVALDTTFAGVNPTGVGLYSRRLAQGLRNDSAQLGLELKCYGPACHTADPKSNVLGLFQEWPTYTHGVLPAQLLASRPQIVHSTSHIGPIWGPGRLIVTVHDLIFMRYPQDYQAGWLLLTRLLLPPVLRRARAIVADSQSTRKDIQRFFGVRPGKIFVIYPGVDVPVPSSSHGERQSMLTVTGGQPFILCPGPWVRRKNIEVVMQAFAMLAARNPALHLVVTGDRPPGMSGPTRGELLALVPGQYQSRVHLVGYVSQRERDALVSAASVLCYPSRYEGFGLPPLEAMLHGVPVVVAATPVSIEVTGGAALLAHPDQPSDWAAAIDSILSDASIGGKLSELGRQRSALFTWSRCVQETAHLYHRVGEA